MLDVEAVVEWGRQLDIYRATLSLRVKIKVQDLCLTECSSLAECGSKYKKEVAALCRPDCLWQQKERRAKIGTLIYSKRYQCHNNVGSDCVQALKCC